MVVGFPTHGAGGTNAFTEHRWKSDCDIPTRRPTHENGYAALMVSLLRILGTASMDVSRLVAEVTAAAVFGAPTLCGTGRLPGHHRRSARVAISLRAIADRRCGLVLPGNQRLRPS